MIKNRVSLIFILFIGSFYMANAQLKVENKTSPLAMVSIKNRNTYIKITYSQPHKRGREIFGSLVPYGQVWRTGANDATEITTTKAIEIGAQLLPAGTYSVFTIPEQKEWTIIINSAVGLWGTDNYNPSKNLLRIKAKVSMQAEPIFEPFTIQLTQTNKQGSLDFYWDNVKVSVPIKFLQ